MTILIACDKFKNSLSAIKVCTAIANGLQHKNTNLEILMHPMADGGDGTLAVLQEHIELNLHKIETINPLNKNIQASYASFNNTAYIELAKASGIELIQKEDLNPMITTTIGTGYLVKDAIINGFKNIVISIGGSCTTDAGLGIAHALGFTFLDYSGDELMPSGGTLSQIKSIIKPAEKITCQFTILCDVDNPLFGSNGAAYVFGPQKGATKEQVRTLDEGLRHIANLIHSFNNKNIGSIKGGGAAGGISAGLYGLLDAEIKSGFDYLSSLSKLEDKIASADIVITGEGQLDDQSFSGKVVGEIQALCQKYTKPIIAVVGNSTVSPQDYKEKGLTDVFSIMEVTKNLNDAMSHTESYLKKIALEINLDLYLKL